MMVLFVRHSAAKLVFKPITAQIWVYIQLCCNLLVEERIFSDVKFLADWHTFKKGVLNFCIMFRLGSIMELRAVYKKM
jgi:hypothetical protein